MPETEEQREKRLLRELEGKNIEYYSVLLSAWINTKMEFDKTLVTLSSFAIGLLITILTTIGVSDYVEVALFSIAIMLFIITIFSSLKIYQLNAKHIENSLSGNKDKLNLEKYDKLSKYTFTIGAVFALLIGIYSAIINLHNKEKIMEKNNQNTTTTIFNDSFDKVESLNPDTLSKSFDNIETLKPKETNSEQNNSNENNKDKNK